MPLYGGTRPVEASDSKVCAVGGLQILAWTRLPVRENLFSYDAFKNAEGAAGSVSYTHLTLPTT